MTAPSAIITRHHQVSQFASRLIGDLAFVTQRTADAFEAIAILEMDHDIADIIILDVVMRGMNGIELGKKIRTMAPQDGSANQRF
ncbi:response regulator [Sphingobium yanoikuyae]|uniref:response regulator n=1 Tax=Sphingobium yanoikuyae TaxID=13690 RepID=UPI003AF7A3ED